MADRTTVPIRVRVWSSGLATVLPAVAMAVGGAACGKETGPEAPAAAALGTVDAGDLTGPLAASELAAIDAGGLTDGPIKPSPAEVPACSKPCTSTAECACGRDRASGQCAVGRAECIDTSNPCPDFCTGIDGRRWTACIHGACTTTRTR
jgi:hypothetical protein